MFTKFILHTKYHKIILSHILKKEFQSVTIKTKRTRAKVQCHCNKCKEKLVDSHTKKRYDNEISS